MNILEETGLGSISKGWSKLTPLTRWGEPQRVQTVVVGVALSTALLFPLIVRSAYALDLAIMGGLYLIMALGLDLVLGHAGLPDLGYVGFYAVGAYTTAILGTRFGVPFWISLPLGGILASALGVLLGIPVLRMRPGYLALATFGFAEVIRIAIRNFDTLTGGPNGIVGVPRPVLFGLTLNRPIHFYYLVLVFVIFTIVFVHRLSNSRIGLAWLCIREDGLAAEAMGIDIVRSKLLAFGLGALWGGLAGAIFAAKLTAVAPEAFTAHESILVFVIIVVGGMGSVPGIFLGVLLMVILPHLLRGFIDYRFIIFGLVVMIMMIVRPQGLWPRPRRRAMIMARKSQQQIKEVTASTHGGGSDG